MVAKPLMYYGSASDAEGTYSLLDKNPAAGPDRYHIIVNARGRVVKLPNRPNNWQTDLSNLMPGTGVLQAVSSSDNGLVS